VIKALVVVCLLVLLYCAFSPQAAAQAGSNCIQRVTDGCQYGGYVVAPCPGWFDCWGDGIGYINCAGWSSACPPSAGPPETAPGPNCPLGSPCQQPRASLPVSLTSGNTYIEENDIRIPGLGGGLSLTRTWNSMWPTTQLIYEVGMFGLNWRSNFEERIFVGTDNYVKWARGDGSFWSFGVGYAVAAPANAGATLSFGTSYWTLTLKDGEKRLFDVTSGNLVDIIDRNGNTTQLSYDAGGRLAAVTGPASRHLYFSYGDSQNAFLVTSVTSDFGVSTSYSYDNQNRLVQVAEPDGSTLSFDYNSQSLIADVKDSSGKILESHTYDAAGRGLTSSRANGVESITVSYPTQ
jgi:YD repeat-containing protein